MDLNVVSINTIDSNRTPPRARSVSPERRQQYRSKGRYVRCGSHNHWVNNCSLRPFSLAQGTKPKTGRAAIAALDDDAYDNDDAWLEGPGSSLNSRDMEILDRLD